MVRQSEIDDALHRVGFNGNIIDFDREYTLKSTTIDVLSKPTFRNIINRYTLYQIENNRNVAHRKISVSRMGKKRIKNLIGFFLERQNEKSSATKYELGEVNKFGNTYLLHISLVKESDIQQIRKTKINLKDTKKFHSICINLDDKTLSIYGAPRYFVLKLDSWIKSKSRINIAPFVEQQYKTLDVEKLLNDPDVRFFEIGLRQTQYNESDKIIVVSRRGEGKNYVSRVKEVLMQNRALGLYDIAHLSISYKYNPVVKIKFERRLGSKNLNVNLVVRHNHVDYLPDYVKDIVREEVLLYDEIPDVIMLSNIMQKGYLDKSEYFNPSYQKYVNLLKQAKVLNTHKSYKYRCSNPHCYYKSKTSMFNSYCKCGQKTNKRYMEFLVTDINHKKITKLLLKAMRSLGLNCNRMPEKYFGIKESDIARISIQEKDLFLIINKKGLSIKTFDDLKLLGLPIILINLKGEISSNLPNFGMIDCTNLVNCLTKNDFSIIPKLIENFNENSSELKLQSFKESLKRLKGNTYSTPEEFERMVYGTLGFIFKSARRWGGKNLADGSYGIKFKKVRYGLWDAKRYLKSSLLNYIKKNALKKDIKYMESFNNNKIIARFGNLSQYLFVTSNFEKLDFLKVSDELRLQILNSKAKTKIKNCKIGCINSKELGKLGGFYLQNFERMQDLDSANKIIYRSINKNDGYFEFGKVREALTRLLVKDVRFPKIKEIRDETRENMDIDKLAPDSI